MKFPCTSCGACCREAVRLGCFSSLDGTSCVHQVGEIGQVSHCLIYETRPAVCRVEANKPVEVSLIDFYKHIAETCAALQVVEGLGPEWRVVIEEGSEVFDASTQKSIESV